MKLDVPLKVEDTPVGPIHGAAFLVIHTTLAPGLRQYLFHFQFSEKFQGCQAVHGTRPISGEMTRQQKE
jgi:hypothetical protein